MPLALPSSLNRENRSVRVILATESPIEMWDYSRGEVVPEVLLMSGLELPASGSVPLLNSHVRDSVDRIIGRLADFAVVNDLLETTAYFSSQEMAVFEKVADGSLTSLSAGYAVGQRVFVPYGESRIIGNRKLTGPVNAVTKWTLFEGSFVPIPADSRCIVRTNTVNVLTRVGEPGPAAAMVGQQSPIVPGVNLLKESYKAILREREAAELAARKGERELRMNHPYPWCLPDLDSKPIQTNADVGAAIRESLTNGGIECPKCRKRSLFYRSKDASGIVYFDCRHCGHVAKEQGSIPGGHLCPKCDTRCAKPSMYSGSTVGMRCQNTACGHQWTHWGQAPTA